LYKVDAHDPVTLSAAAQSNVVVSLSSSNNSVAKPTVNSITITSGTTGTFTVKTFRVNSKKTVKIKATANGTSTEATLTVTKTALPAALGLILSVAAGI